MRGIQLLSVVTFLSLAACQIDTGDFDNDFDVEEVGHAQQASIGGVPAQGQAHYDAVAAITILLPGATNDAARLENLYCTGVLIEEKTVMTAASCLYQNLEAELDEDFTGNYLDPASVFVQFGANISGTTEYALDATLDSTANDTKVSVKGVTLHRYYNPDLSGQNDIVLLSLSVAPGIAPVALHDMALSQADVGQPLELVGYGGDGMLDPKDIFRARTVVTTPIVSVTEDRITAGTETETTCNADSGGPGFMNFGNGPVVVSLTVYRTDCREDVNRQRIDLHATSFLNPFIKYAGGCAGCNDCEFNGTCEEACASRDWDCGPGASVGDPCSQDGECEEGGACVAATDDTTFSYCDKPCSPDNTGDCLVDMMTCESDRCVFAGISPGSQGAPCVLTSECRSGFCENSKCAYECDAATVNACDEEGGFFCLTSLADGSTTVCRTELRTGGGGFCHAGALVSQKSERNSLLAGLSLLLLVGLFRRRRID